MAPHVFGPLWCVAWFGTRHRHPKVRSTPRRPLSRISPEFALPARHSLLLPAHACTYTSTHCRPVHDDPRMPAPCPASAELNVIPSFARRISIAAAWIRSGPRASLLLQLDGAAMGGKDYASFGSIWLNLSIANGSPRWILRTWSATAALTSAGMHAAWVSCE